MPCFEDGEIVSLWLLMMRDESLLGDPCRDDRKSSKSRRHDAGGYGPRKTDIRSWKVYLRDVYRQPVQVFVTKTIIKMGERGAECYLLSESVSE